MSAVARACFPLPLRAIHRNPSHSVCDVSAPAVEASRATLATNGVEGEVFASNVFSEVKGRFDMIISNPPFHDGMQTSSDAAQTLIRGAVRHLNNSGGELRIVANAFLPYPDVLDETFGFHEVIAQTGRFKVYRAIMTRRAKKVKYPAAMSDAACSHLQNLHVSSDAAIRRARVAPTNLNYP